MKILIVEDHLNDRNMLRMYLERQGCEDIVTASNGVEGLEMARQYVPDLIISDALMPQMDGFQFLRAVKTDPALSDIPFIFYSAVYIGDKEEELALSLGAEAFIAKPKEPEEFWDCLAAALRRREGETGKAPVRTVLEEDEEFLSRYNQIVTSKLEEKVRELEEALARLREADTALRTANEELETRVARRTAELETNRAELASQNAELATTCRRLEVETAERIRTLEELGNRDRMLVQQSRMAAMGEMLNNIAHHWRQPLNLVALTLQDLLLPYEVGREETEAKINKAIQTIFQLSKTIDDIRTVSVPDTERRLFSVASVVAKNVSLVEETFKESGIAISLESKGEPQALGYPNEFGHVILNLLMNASDTFRARGLSNGRVTVQCWTEGGKAVVTVTDNAGGVEPQNLDRIFDAYFTTKPGGHGTGLGLFMSKTIIERNMGGRLTACNVEGGAEFRIAL